MGAPITVVQTESPRTLTCPHCLIAFRSPVLILNLGADTEKNWFIETQTCPTCGKFILYLVNTAVQTPPNPLPYQAANVLTRTLIRPRGANRPPLPPEVLDPYREDYLEACLVLPDSAKASAALSRRCLQHLLREEGKTKSKDLADRIEEILKENRLPSYLAEIVDAVRNIGNFAAHPNKSKSTGEIVEVETGEAELNLEVLESLFDFYFVQPVKTKERLEAINLKLKDAGKPPLKRP